MVWFTSLIYLFTLLYDNDINILNSFHLLTTSLRHDYLLFLILGIVNYGYLVVICCKILFI